MRLVLFTSGNLDPAATSLDLRAHGNLASPSTLWLCFEWNPSFNFRDSQAPSDELWKSTCFEAFLQLKDGAYLELNLALDGRCNAYHFDAYRTPQPPRPLPGARLSHFETSPGRCEAWFEIPQELLAQVQRAGLTAVIEPEEGPIRYWALHHAGPQPDFHDPKSFVLERKSIEG